ncbi:gamma-glutamyltransferase family protein [Mesobacterium pallidum]|uniref:gamma-glutamyltransferase family protein n=1 Tax=Mesobacterium pallidum TaxID=2872037 RepID=UPI001EE21347|nr:gamma-glutamyltransferase family protein [Mesobacterium pallidum]
MRDFSLPGRSATYAANGMCATSHPLAAKVALDILQAGGNAVDAAVAGAVLLGVCEPSMTGLGGDCFALIAQPGAPVQALNGSGRAVAAADPEALRARGLTAIEPHSTDAITLPGAVDAFCHLAETQGKLGLDRLLAPAIHYADAGIPVAPRVARDWVADGPALQGHGRDHYLDAGNPLTIGQLFRAPGQAEALRRVARQGRDGFYAGEVAEDMVASLQAAGGAHTLDDFARVACTPTAPIGAPVEGYELLEHPPNGQGATALLMLNILGYFDIAAMDPFGAERAHVEAEAAKLAYDARNRFIADPDVLDATERMISPATAKALAALIHPDRALPYPVSPLTEQVHKDTVYITVVDRDRMAVSLIYSIFNGFGSGLASKKFGILFQNRGAGFNLTKGHPNELGPGKRPLHTIIPAMLMHGGRAVMPYGVMGGQYQPVGHVRVLQNMLLWGMDPQEAIDGARCFADAGKLQLESGYSDAVAAELAARGHDIDRITKPLGGGQAIRILGNGVLEGGSDPRKDGCAIGY